MAEQTPNPDQPRRNGPNKDLRKRIPKEIIWKDVQSEWKRFQKQAKYLGLDPEAQIEFADKEIEKLYLDVQISTSETITTKELPEQTSPEPQNEPDRSCAQIIDQPTTDNQTSAVIGLNRIPADWLPLPGNASLQQEIAWVQANRLLVVDERGDKTYVFLEKARNPAPSYAALGWLETSIKVYSKFVEVAAKATAAVASEEEGIKLERVAIDEVKRILSEMLEVPSNENAGET